MKKTLLVTIDYPPAIGGVSTYWKQVVHSLPKDDLVVLTVPGETLQDKENVIRESLFFAFLWPKWIKGIYHIWKVYHDNNCEQILVGQVLPVGAMVYCLQLFKKIPYSVQVYGMDLLMASKSSRKNKLAKKILQSSQRIFANSQAIADIVMNLTCREDTNIIYPIPKQLPKPEVKIEKELLKKYQLKNETIVVTLGRLVARKGQDKTLGAMTHVWQLHPNTTYVIVGDGPDRKRLEKMADAHKSKVIFTGKVSNQERDAWLSLADIFIMPARKTSHDIEGYGIVYLEANSLGIPVIAGNIGGPKEAVVHEKTGLLVDPEDIDDIAQALLRLIEHPEFAKELGENGQKRLKTELSWEKEVEKLKDQLG